MLNCFLCLSTYLTENTLNTQLFLWSELFLTGKKSVTHSHQHYLIYQGAITSVFLCHHNMLTI